MTVAAAAAFALGGCGLAKNGVGVAPRRAGLSLARFSQSRPSLGATLTITVIAAEDRDAKVGATIEHAFGDAETIEKTLLDAAAKINGAGANAVEIPDDVIAAVERTAAVSHASQGALDAKLDWTKIQVDRKAHTVQLPENATLEFSAIAPGMVVDAAADTLRENGFDDFSVESASTQFFGGDAGGAPWKAAIGDAATVAIRDQAIATRGGTSVIAADTITASLYATAAGASADGNGLLLARGLDGVRVSSDDLFATLALKERLELTGWKKNVVWLAPLKSARAP